MRTGITSLVPPNIASKVAAWITQPSGREREERYAKSTISGPKLTSRTIAIANGNMRDAAEVDVTLNGNADGVTLVILTGWSHS